MLEVVSLVKKFGTMAAVNGVDLKTVAGETVALLGPSGCGKTTTLRCIAGLERPDSGEIWIDGKLVSSKNVFVPPEKRNIGMVFQSYALWPHMTVFNNVAYPLRIKKLPKNEIRQRVNDVLEMVGLKEMSERYPHQLSGGQQQRVALARAIVYQPRLLLLDEPLSNLDAKLREQMRYELRRLLKNIGITAVYVTHDQEEAFVIADRIAIMNQGKIIQMGKPMEIYEHPLSTFVAGFIGRVNIFKARVVERSADDGYGMIYIDAGDSIPLKCRIPSTVKDVCAAIIRANEIHVTSDPTKYKENVIVGTVSEISFRGQSLDIRLSLFNESVLTISTHRFDKDVLNKEIQVGKTAYAYIEPEAIVLTVD
jgi:iron(III) transport system ATP-binding protein